MILSKCNYKNNLFIETVWNDMEKEKNVLSFKFWHYEMRKLSSLELNIHCKGYQHMSVVSA